MNINNKLEAKGKRIAELEAKLNHYVAVEGDEQ